MTRRRVLATAVRLLDLGFFRIGSDRYTELNHSYGLTTLLREHSRCRAGAVLFTYTGKHGKEIVQTVADPAACRSLTALMRRRGGGDRLLAYWERPAWREVNGDDVNTYLKEAAGLEITAKDFRTWHATVMAAVALLAASLFTHRCGRVGAYTCASFTSAPSIRRRPAPTARRSAANSSRSSRAAWASTARRAAFNCRR
ncbi:hypothetical protein [Streptomyces sp. bgisy159]|uniref:hypothetical protein n=1 Tax=Streptomyces sp. bgisy159 TaxID=3413795 RepID=UPI003F4A1916